MRYHSMVTPLSALPYIGVGDRVEFKPGRVGQVTAVNGSQYQVRRGTDSAWYSRRSIKLVPGAKLASTALGLDGPTGVFADDIKRHTG